MFEDNRKFARLRIEREASQSLRVEGASTCGQFLPGQHFLLAGAPPADGPYLLTRVDHQVRQTGYRSGEEIGADYRNAFVAAPKEVPYRSPRVTPRPDGHGLQPAVVVGPKGEEIFTDRFGRVKVQFLWDREGKSDAHSSCWIRVAQAHAGKGFGFVSLPRIGEEVLVAFAGDNPDRPVIIGRVYNANNLPPFALPQKRTRSGLRSQSVGGSAEQYSGLAIDDRLGQEHLGVHAERHMTQSSEGLMMQWVGGDHQTVVGRSSTRVGGLPGALQKSPAQPQGSGTGGGSALTDAQYVLRDADIQFGWSSDGVIGTQSELVFGQHIETTINPIGGLESLFGANMELTPGSGPLSDFARKFAIAAGSAHTEVTIGNHCEILHGLGLEFSRGQSVEGSKEHTSVLGKIWAAFYTLVAATVDIAMPLADLWIVNSPVSSDDDSAKNWAQVGEKETLNLLARTLMDTMLAVWIGIEMKEEAVEIEKVVANELDANLKQEIDTSREQAEALLREALEAQQKALQKTVDTMFAKHATEIGTLEEGVTALRTAATKRLDGLYSVFANSMNLAVTGDEKQASTVLSLKALRPILNELAKASVDIYATNLVKLSTQNLRRSR